MDKKSTPQSSKKQQSRKWLWVCICIASLLVIYAAFVLPLAQRYRTNTFIKHRVNQLGGKVGIEVTQFMNIFPLNWHTWGLDILGEDFRWALLEIYRIHFEGTHLSDDELESVKGSSYVRFINLGGTEITNKGLFLLKEYPNLDNLLIGGTSISDEGLVHLKVLENLRALSFGGYRRSKISDSGAIHLSKMGTLEILDISNTQITDIGLREIRKMKNLKILYLKRLSVTKKEIAKLKKALPKCRVEM